MKSTLGALGLLVMAAAAFAVDGKSTPPQVLELDPAWLRQQGLELPARRYLLWMLDQVEHADELLRELGVER